VEHAVQQALAALLTDRLRLVRGLKLNTLSGDSLKKAFATAKELASNKGAPPILEEPNGYRRGITSDKPVLNELTVFASSCSPMRPKMNLTHRCGLWSRREEEAEAYSAGARSEYIRLEASKDLLDRAGFKPWFTTGLTST
jgi:hypothetical protein